MLEIIIYCLTAFFIILAWYSDLKIIKREYRVNFDCKHKPKRIFSIQKGEL